MLTIKRASLIRSIAVLFWVISFGSSAQTNWPNGQTVRVIVPFPGGASTLDSVVRTVTPEISKFLGSPVIVDNKPGAGTVIGVDATAKATDNLTVGGVANSFTVNQSLIKTLPYNTTKDLQPVVLMARTANVLAVKSNLPVNNLKELVDYAKKNPGKLSYASFGNGTTAHFAGEMLKSMAGIYVVHIPYRGQGPALTDLIAGNVDVMFDGLGSSAAHIKGGRIKALMVSGNKRNPAFPDVPCAAEVGLPDYTVTTWYGVWAPKGTPADVQARIVDELGKAARSDELKAIWASNGAEFGNMTPVQFGTFISGEVKRWAAVVKTSGAKLD